MVTQRGQVGIVFGGILALVVVIGVIAVLLSHAQVDAGEVGVISQWGAIDVKQQPLAPGWHWIAPFQGINVDNVSVRPERHPFKEVSAATHENQNVYIDGGINYHINPDEAAGIRVAGGIGAYIDRIFNPAFQDYIKTESVKYTSAPGQKDSILLNRDPLREAVLTRLRDKATNDASVSYHITVDDIFLTDIHFDKTYNDAIEKAAVAQQQLAQSKIDAQKAVTTAQGQGDALRASAQGEADANRIKAASLTTDLVNYTAIQKWNGVLPQVTGSATPFVNITTK